MELIIPIIIINAKVGETWNRHLGYYVSEAMDRSSDYIYILQKQPCTDFPLCGVLYILPLL